MWRMDLWDSHCHLDVDDFAPDREAVLARARAAGVGHILVPAITAAGWDALGALCAGDPGLHPAYGLHPMYLDAHGPGDLEALDRRLDAERPAAVGECGLDFHLRELDPERQRELFLGQLALAREHRLPVVVHARKAVDTVLKHARRFPGVRGVVHSFSGSLEQARALVDQGFLLGVGGPVTYPRARRLRAVVAEMPLEALVLETDAPDQPLSGRQGARNEPAFVAEVLGVVAELREAEPAEVARVTSRNAAELFAGAAQTGGQAPGGGVRRPRTS